jgi:hypothetical protein
MNRPKLAMLGLALCASAAQAEDYLSPSEERVRISLGFMYLASDTNVRVDSSAGTMGTLVNGEDTLGLEKHDFEPKFQAMVRVDERNRLRFDYFTLDRSGSTTLDQSVIFGNVALPAGQTVHSDLSLTNLGITYGYSVIHRDKVEIAATLGVQITDVSSRARISTSTLSVDQRNDAAGPFPVVGLDATWVISKRFYVDGRAQYLRLHVDQLDGSLGMYELDALYRLRPNVAFALGYNLVRANLMSTQSKKGGEFDFDTKGPQLFVRVSF